GKDGIVDYRIEELRRMHKATAVIDSLRVYDLLSLERLDSPDYAVSYSFIYYLVKNEPDALGQVLARAREGKASRLGVIAVFDDMSKTEENWQKSTRKLVL